MPLAAKATDEAAARANQANAGTVRKRPHIVHPLFFALFPLWSLYASNVEQIPLWSMTRPSLVLLGGVLLLWRLLRAVVKDNKRAALLLSALIFLFFSYGHVLGAMRDAHGLAGQIGRNRFLLPLWLLLLSAAAGAALRSRRDLTQINSFLNVLGAACLSLALAQGAWGQGAWGLVRQPKTGPTRLSPQTEQGQAAPHQLPPHQLAAGTPAQAPDIYYIILDAYGRADVLRDLYGYDNAPFLRELAKRGFYIAARSQSNYPQTVLSLASSLNLNYLDDFARRMGRDAGDKGPAYQLIKNNQVAAFLRRRGYRMFCVTTGHDWIETPGAQIVRAKASTTEIEELLFDITPLPAVHQASAFRYNQRRQLLSYGLDYLSAVPGPDTAGRQSPRFVFAHILAPHPPFVWDEKGRTVNPHRPFAYADGSFFMELGGTPQEYREHYIAQLAYLNTRVLQAVDAIMARSRQRPIIILQGDHGPGMRLSLTSLEHTDTRERLSILNALYLPAHGRPVGAERSLYPKISPVNTFRLIFNRYFGTHYSLLQDRSFYSPWQRPYAFVDVSEKEKPAR